MKNNSTHPGTPLGPLPKSVTTLTTLSTAASPVDHGVDDDQHPPPRTGKKSSRGTIVADSEASIDDATAAAADDDEHAYTSVQSFDRRASAATQRAEENGKIKSKTIIKQESIPDSANLTAPKPSSLALQIAAAAPLATTINVFNAVNRQVGQYHPPPTPPPDSRIRRLGHAFHVLTGIRIFSLEQKKTRRHASHAGLGEEMVQDDFLHKFAMGNIQGGGGAGGAGQQTAAMASFFGLRMQHWWFTDPSMPAYYRWLVVVSMAVVYNLIIIIVRSVFNELHDDHMVLWLALDYIADAIYVVDMAVCMFTGYLEHGLLVRDMTKLRQHYTNGPNFWYDIASIFPTDIVYLIMNTYRAPWCALRLNRLLRFGRLREFFYRTATQTSYPNMFRIVEILFYIAITIHWNACFYFAVSEAIGLGSDGWVYPCRYAEFDFSSMGLPEHRNFENDPVLLKYVFCFFWSTLTLTTMGQTPEPARTIEFLYIIVDLMCGVLIFATVVGSVGSIITTMSVPRIKFQNEMDAVKQYMEFRRVGKDLNHRVVKWFDYIWSNKQALHEEDALNMLPDKLKAEIGMHVHLETLKQVRIFQDAEPGLLVELVLKLKLQVFSPGAYICRKGDIGKEMYIVKRGRLSVVADDGVTVFATLSEGSVFGELSILNIAGNKTGNRRSANVRSIGYSDLFVLSKDDLWAALDEYPDAKKLMIERGRQILLKDNLVDEQGLRDAEEEEADVKRRIQNVENNVDDIHTRLARLLAEFTSMKQKADHRVEKLQNRAASARRPKPPSAAAGAAPA